MSGCARPHTGLCPSCCPSCLMSLAWCCSALSTSRVWRSSQGLSRICPEIHLGSHLGIYQPSFLHPWVALSPTTPPPHGHCVPTARWQKPFKTKHTVLLPFMRHGHRPVDVLTMTSKKYPVASFTDPRLQVQVLHPRARVA